MWNGKSITIVLPTYREKSSIRKTINDFESLGICDEILVINNNAEAGTSEEVAMTIAREIFEPIQGYGAAIKRGLISAKSDLIVICEPDSTFIPSDLQKLLAFTDQCEVVLGSRTVNSFIWSGANMGNFLKWGNWFVAKMMEVLFNSAYLSDVGCTFRIISREAINSLNLKKFTNDGRFGMEILLSSVMQKKKLVQVPVNYLPRIGISGYTGNFIGAFNLGLRMIKLIIIRRLGSANYYDS